jgi:hypothetical protein
MSADDRNDELEPIDAELDALLEPARTVEPVAPSRRETIRRRLEDTVESLDAPARSRGRWLVALVSVVAAAALLWWIAAARPSDDAGSVETGAERVTVATGDRATVVVEPHGSVRWTVEDGNAAVDQPNGRAFYRVEPGGDYVVRTPHVEVRVTGTSFEVEVVMSNNTQRWKHMGLGAAVAAATVVTVYEGRVVLANDEGVTSVEAGQRAVAIPGQPPNTPQSRVASTDVDVASVAATTPAVAVSSGARESVLVADLRARVRELEDELADARKTNDEHETVKNKRSAEFIQRMYDPTPEQLLEAAEDCAISFAAPQKSEAGEYLAPEQVERLGLTPQQVAAITTALDEEQSAWLERLRDLYVDGTGDEAGAASLSDEAMQAELLDKASKEDRKRAQIIVARELAGLAEPTADAQSEPVVRYYRAEVARTRRAFRVLADTLGDEAGVYDALAHMPTSITQLGGCED